MSGAIVNYANLNAANTAFEAAFIEVFGGGPKGTWQNAAMKVSAKAKFFELDAIGSFPRVREWTGSKVFKTFRAYKKSITLVTHEASTYIDRKSVDYDPTGAVGQALAQFARSQEYVYDDLMWAKLLTNPTGYDGVSLLNDSHPNVASTGTSDNLTTSALTYATFRTGIDAMESVTDEDGKPLGIYPTDLFVGPAQRRVALDVTGATRPINADATGGYDVTSSAIAVTTIQNAFAGEVNVHVVPWITGNEWFLMDLSKAGARPMVCFEARGPIYIPVTEMNASSRFFNDQYLYSIEADVAFDAGMWQLIYGSVSA